jgi:hypothetical protein
MPLYAIVPFCAFSLLRNINLSGVGFGPFAAFKSNQKGGDTPESAVVAAARFRTTINNLPDFLKLSRFFPTLRRRTSFPFLRTAFSERMILF